MKVLNISNNKKVIFIIFSIYIFFNLLTSCNLNHKMKDKPQLKKGYVNLSNWDFKKDGIYKLHGEWEFYWNQLFTPDDLKTNDILKKKLYIEDSKKWIYLKNNNKDIKKQGYATYKIIIKIKDDTKIMAIKVPIIWSSYNIWINNNLYKCGIVGKERKYSKPYTTPKTFIFKPDSDTVQLTLQVSNFFDNCGGISSHILFGTADQITNKNIKLAAYNFLLFGSIIIISFYHFGLYILNKKNKIPLYFGIFCLIIASRVLVIGEEFIFLLFPNFNWELSIKIEYISIYLGLPVFMFFTYKQFSEDFSKNITHLTLILGFSFSLIVIILPARLYSNTLLIYQIILILETFYVIIILIISIKNKRTGSFLFTSGLLIFSITVINDILYNNEIIKTGYYAPLGLFIFILIHSFILSKKSSELYLKTENLSKELQEYSNKLEEKVRLRTNQLEEANKEKTNFFINIAHETKTPLTLISNYLNKFINKYGFFKEIGIIKQNIDKLYHDMINYLDAEKLEHSQMFYNHNQIFNISDLLKNKILLFKEIAKKKNISIKSDIEKEVYIKADPEAIDRIINNLIDNAIKYTFDKGNIHVELKTSDGLIIIKIKDTGIGISEKEKNNIFLPFHQISNPKRNIQGIGMGLFIVKKIIDSLDGVIEILNNTENIFKEENLNKGSIFIIKLKKYSLKKEDEVKNIYTNEPIDNISYSYSKDITDSEYIKGRNNILLVEDNPDMLVYLKEELSQDHNIFLANNGKSAIDKLNIVNNIDLIISDIMMDGMNGYEFLEKVYSDENFSHIPFIFLTAKTTENEKIKGLSIGAVDYICKPFSISEINTKIKSILDIKKRQKNTIIDEAILLLKKGMNNPEQKDEKWLIFEKNAKGKKLTKREKEILIQLSNGLEYKEIAAKLKISYKTVDTHVQNLYKKTGLHNKIELINYFFK